jgi:hypothetical protein
MTGVLSPGDKLAGVKDGNALRLFVWKLHNAVSSSIARSEEWYQSTDAVNTCRYWPNIEGTVRVFRQQFTLKDAIGSHACSLEASIWHSSRESTALTGWHCYLCRNIEGLAHRGSLHTGLISADRVQKTIDLLEVATRLSSMRATLTQRLTASNVAPIAAQAAQLVAKLDTLMLESGFFEEVFGFVSGVVEATPDQARSEAMGALVRNEHFTLN